jgi:hypothetical protein
LPATTAVYQHRHATAKKPRNAVTGEFAVIPHYHSSARRENEFSRRPVLKRKIEDRREGALSVTERNSAFGEIVRGEFQSDFIARQNADAIAAKPARQVSQNHTLMFELYTEQAAGKFL